MREKAIFSSYNSMRLFPFFKLFKKKKEGQNEQGFMNFLIFCIKMQAEIVQNRADLTYAFKLCRGRTPLLSTLSLILRNFKKAQATPLSGVCRPYAGLQGYAVRSTENQT